MMSFHKHSINMLLKEWAADLSQAAATADAQMPSWAAAFQSGIFNESLAMTLTKNKNVLVARAHNDLHNTLTRYMGAATTIGLSPPLKAHPATQGPATIALHSLTMARSTSTLIQGLELYTKVKSSPTGPNDIAVFLSKHPPESRSAVPSAFWRTLEAFAMDSSGKGAPTPRPTEAPSASMRVKLEPSASSLSASATIQPQSMPAPAARTTAAEADGSATLRLKRRRK